MSMEHARRRAMWFNGCNRYKKPLISENTTESAQQVIDYFAQKKEPKRTKEQIEEERLFYTSTR